jgi:hypothetical protein
VAHLDKIITRRNQRVLLVLLVIVNAKKFRVFCVYLLTIHYSEWYWYIR